jgi:hypothetical protein
MISGMALSNQSDLLAFFSPWKVNLKIGLIPEDNLWENGQIPEDDLQSARLSHQSSESSPPAPSPASECCPLLWFQGDAVACERGGGGAISDKETDTLVL